jgi:hypothetical protein
MSGPTDHYAEFFGQLTNKCVERGFTKFHMTPRQIQTLGFEARPAFLCPRSSRSWWIKAPVTTCSIDKS